MVGKRVLLIEDEANIAEALRYILSRDGFAVDIHSDGGTAMVAIAEKSPDVVVLDAMLPNRSGCDILQDLRGQLDTRDLPVLMLTARGQKQDREMAERYGADKFVTKPFSNADVLNSVRELAAS